MNITKLIFSGFNITYHEGFTLIHKPTSCITNEDMSLIKATLNVPDYMVWKSDYQTVTIG